MAAGPDQPLVPPVAVGVGGPYKVTVSFIVTGPGGPPSAHWRLPSVHPDGRKFVAGAGVVTLFFLLIGWTNFFWPLLALNLGIGAFFRDPVRAVPQGEALILAPADGLITMITEVPPPRELAGESGLVDPLVTRVSIFLSVFDVHVQRAPITGVVRQLVYISGKYLNANLDKASEDNERQHILIENATGLRIGFTMIAGLVARRIVPFVKAGDTLVAGQRVGLIRFGSRVDVYLPIGTAPRVAIGQRTVAGETVLAMVGARETLRVITQ